MKGGDQFQGQTARLAGLLGQQRGSKEDQGLQLSEAVGGFFCRCTSVKAGLYTSGNGFKIGCPANPGNVPRSWQSLTIISTAALTLTAPRRSHVVRGTPFPAAPMEHREDQTVPGVVQAEGGLPLVLCKQEVSLPATSSFFWGGVNGMT